MNDGVKDVDDDDDAEMMQNLLNGQDNKQDFQWVKKFDGMRDLLMIEMQKD